MSIWWRSATLSRSSRRNIHARRRSSSCTSSAGSRSKRYPPSLPPTRWPCRSAPSSATCDLRAPGCSARSKKNNEQADGERSAMNRHDERVAELFAAAIDYEPDERSAFLASACADQPLLLAEVEALL